MAMLGLRPMLVGAVGADFADYRQWLEAHSVDTRHVRVSRDLHTARFLCTTDADNNQIASFYAGAMNEARHIDLAGDPAIQHDDVDIVLICPDDPEAMLRHTQACRGTASAVRRRPLPADRPHAGDAISAQLVDGARYLFTNEYERALLTRKTGWTAGRDTGPGRHLGDHDRAEGRHHRVRRAGPAVTRSPLRARAAGGRPDRGGRRLPGRLPRRRRLGLSVQRAAQIGCVMAVLVMETAGTQEYGFDPGDFGARLAEAYGPDAATEVTACLAPGRTAPAGHTETSTERT